MNVLVVRIMNMGVSMLRGAVLVRMLVTFGQMQPDCGFRRRRTAFR